MEDLARTISSESVCTYDDVLAALRMAEDTERAEIIVRAACRMVAAGGATTASAYVAWIRQIANNLGAMSAAPCTGRSRDVT